MHMLIQKNKANMYIFIKRNRMFLLKTKTVTV